MYNSNELPRDLRQRNYKFKGFRPHPALGGRGRSELLTSCLPLGPVPDWRVMLIFRAGRWARVIHCGPGRSEWLRHTHKVSPETLSVFISVVRWPWSAKHNSKSESTTAFNRLKLMLLMLLCFVIFCCVFWLPPSQMYTHTHTNALTLPYLSV